MLSSDYSDDDLLDTAGASNTLNTPTTSEATSQKTQRTLSSSRNNRSRSLSSRSKQKITRKRRFSLFGPANKSSSISTQSSHRKSKDDVKSTLSEPISILAPEGTNVQDALELVTLKHLKGRSRWWHLLFMMGLPLYTFIGAVVFWELEGANDRRVIEQWHVECDLVIENAKLTLSNGVAQSNANQSTHNNIIDKTIQSISQCYDQRKPRPQRPMDKFSYALLYAFTVYTTIGYGDPVAKTLAGRLVTCMYAMFGIPIFIASMVDFTHLTTDLVESTRSYITKKTKKHTSNVIVKIKRHSSKPSKVWPVQQSRKKPEKKKKKTKFKANQVQSKPTNHQSAATTTTTPKQQSNPNNNIIATITTTNNNTPIKSNDRPPKSSNNPTELSKTQSPVDNTAKNTSQQQKLQQQLKDASKQGEVSSEVLKLVGSSSPVVGPGAVYQARRRLNLRTTLNNCRRIWRRQVVKFWMIVVIWLCYLVGTAGLIMELEEYEGQERSYPEWLYFLFESTAVIGFGDFVLQQQNVALMFVTLAFICVGIHMHSVLFYYGSEQIQFASVFLTAHHEYKRLKRERAKTQPDQPMMTEKDMPVEMDVEIPTSVKDLNILMEKDTSEDYRSRAESSESEKTKSRTARSIEV